MKVRAVALILALTLGLLAAPLPVEAQKAGKVYRIGLLTPTFSGFRLAYRLPGFLRTAGYVEGQNVRLEKRFAVGQDERLPELAAELVRLKMDVIVTAGTAATRAAKRATNRIPVVMLAEGDPVKAGLVASLARPGGNITGVTALVPELAAKRLELLKEAVARLTRVAVLWNPTDPDKVEEWNETQAAGRLLGVELQSLEVRSRDDFASAFDAAMSQRADALIVLMDSLTGTHAIQIAQLATENRLPAMYPRSWFVRSHYYGGLMSYGPSTFDLVQRVAAHIDRILKGAKPTDLPVEQPTRVELAVNMKTAKALGLTIPDSILIRADKIVE